MECMKRTVSIFFYFLQDIVIMVTYSDPLGAIQVRTVRSRDLSASWVWKIPGDVTHDQTRSSPVTCHKHISCSSSIQLIWSQF